MKILTLFVCAAVIVVLEWRLSKKDREAQRRRRYDDDEYVSPFTLRNLDER